MKKWLGAVFIPICLLLNGCLNYSIVEIQLYFSEKKSNEGRIEIIYRDLTSDSKSKNSQKSDFNSLVEMLDSDEILLDYMEEGIYVQERDLFEENGTLNARIKGLFRDFKLEEQPVEIEEDYKKIAWEDKDLVLEKTNGTVVRNDSITIVQWPVDQQNLFLKFKQSSPPAETYSILTYYNAWKNRN